jgi:hypothetical protein
MLALLAHYKLGDRAASVLKLRAVAVEPVKAKDAGAVLAGRFNEEARRLGRVVRRRWGVAAERIDPRLRTWQDFHGRNS